VTYGAIADPDRGAPVSGAYHLQNQRRSIGPRGSMVADEEFDATRSLADTWNDLMTTRRAWRALAGNGSVLAIGVPDSVCLMPDNLAIRPGEIPVATANSPAFVVSAWGRSEPESSSH